MNKKNLMRFILVTSLIYTSAQAEDCSQLSTQTDMNMCANKNYKREDELLNQNYKKLTSKLNAERKSQLKEIQRAWIKFRELQCKYTANQYQGGSISSFIQANCLQKMTEQRNEDLKTMIESP